MHQHAPPRMAILKKRVSERTEYMYIYQRLEQSEDEEKVQAEASGIGPLAPLLAYTYPMCPLSRLFFDGARMIHVMIILEQNTEYRRQETGDRRQKNSVTVSAT